MYPTALLGLGSLLLAALYALKPSARLLPLVVSTGAAALLAGALGTVLGLKATVAAVSGERALAAGQLPRLALAGFSESANNLLLALSLCVLVALAVGVGGYRARPAAA